MEEIKVNKDIAEYEQNMFFGFTLRQTLWGAAAVISAAIVFMLTQNRFGSTFGGLLAVIAAAPFAAMGFIKWHGFTAAAAAVKIIRSLLAPRRLLFRCSTIYLEAAKYSTSSKNGKKTAGERSGKKKEKKNDSNH